MDPTPPCRLVIIGSQGHAKAVAEIASAMQDVELVGFVDDFRPPGTPVLSWVVIGSISDVFPAQSHRFNAVVVAIGDNDSRESVVARLRDFQIRYQTLCHPSAYISPSAKIGAGTVLMPHAVVSAEAQLGDHVIINTSAIVEHECVIENFCSLAPNVCLAGQVMLREGAAICMGVNIREKLEIGARATIGAGSTVLHNVAEFSVTYGTPAKHVRRRQLGERHLR
jgi:sugar O-acyltransferase (sialic acid O-acetyltransferase NeuD family)